LPDGFSYNTWLKGLNAGRSFVTTGPMLQVVFNGQPPGQTLKDSPLGKTTCRIQGSVRSAYRQTAIEIISAGRVVQRLTPTNREIAGGAFESTIDEWISADGSSWFAVRCFEQTPDGRPRFAHSAPVFADDATKPLRPRQEEIQYLIDRVKAEIVRHQGVLSDAALDEYQQALRTYEGLIQ
jgi:hypothetical protein